MNNNYDDIINLPHHTSVRYSPMAVSARAAQFSSFSALTGFDEKIKEAARFTNSRLEADDDRKSKIDACLQMLVENQQGYPEISITYFSPDKKKEGGLYITLTGNFKRIDEYEHTLFLTNGVKIPICDIYDIASPHIKQFNIFAE